MGFVLDDDGEFNNENWCSPSTVFFLVAIVRMILYSYGPSYASYKYQQNTIYRMYNPIYNHL